jgi:hypothetical protein
LCTGWSVSAAIGGWPVHKVRDCSSFVHGMVSLGGVSWWGYAQRGSCASERPAYRRHRPTGRSATVGLQPDGTGSTDAGTLGPMNGDTPGNKGPMMGVELRMRRERPALCTGRSVSAAIGGWPVHKVPDRSDFERGPAGSDGEDGWLGARRRQVGIGWS